MFQRLFELGETLAEMDKKENLRDYFRENIADEYKYLVSVKFDKNGMFHTVEGMEIDRNRKAKLVYKKGAGNGTDPTAISKFGEFPSKTVNRVGKALAGIADAIKEDLVSKAADSYAKNQEKITKLVEQKVDELELNLASRGLLSVALETDDGFKHLCENSEVLKWFVDESLSGYGKSKKGAKDDCLAENATCSICHKLSDRVFGNFNELKTYNLDKPGMITGGFSNDQTARNLPICELCAGKVSLGLNTALSSFAYKMGGQTYLLLPECINNELRELVVELAREKRDRESLHDQKLVAITEDENEIICELAERFAESDQVSLKLIFYETKNESWRIKAEIDQVLPSRMKAALDAKKSVEGRPWRGDIDYLSMSVVREFSTGTSANSKREFLAQVSAIFGGKTIERNLFLRNCVDSILQVMKQDEKKANGVIRRAWMLFDFYQTLSILPLQHGKPMNTNLSEKSSYGKFLDLNPDFFGTPEKRVAFLTGALARCVMNAQSKKLGSTPFSKKFRGMRINEESLKKLLADSQEKLRAYDADSFPSNRDLIELICEQWVACGQKFSLTQDETTFLFTVGMTLNYHVTTEYRVEKPDDN